MLRTLVRRLGYTELFSISLAVRRQIEHRSKENPRGTRPTKEAALHGLKTWLKTHVARRLFDELQIGDIVVLDGRSITSGFTGCIVSSGWPCADAKVDTVGSGSLRSR